MGDSSTPVVVSLHMVLWYSGETITLTTRNGFGSKALFCREQIPVITPSKVSLYKFADLALYRWLA